jgi:UDP-N-acetylmuramyl pentapeptide synthase
VPLAILGRELDTRAPGPLARGMAGALWTAWGSRAPVDVMVLELGVRAPGDMRAHLELLRPDIAVVAPLAPSYSEEGDELATLRGEIAALAASAPPLLLLCTDDPFLAELAARTPGAVGFGSDDAARDDATPRLRIGDATWPVGRDVVGASHWRALSVAARVARALGVGDDVIGGYLAGDRTAG